METTAGRPVFTFVHLGVNMPAAADAAELTEQFSSTFGFPVQEGEASYFVGGSLEIIKQPYLGRNGHIAIGTPDVAAAMAYLKNQGYTFDLTTAKYQDGVLSTIYLEQDFGGFAMHLVRKDVTPSTDSFGG